MKIKQPGKILTEKIKEKDRQINSLKEYIEVQRSLILSQFKMITAQENHLRIEEDIIKIYKSYFEE